MYLQGTLLLFLCFFPINPLLSTPDPFVMELNDPTTSKPPKTAFGSKFRPDIFLSLYSIFSPAILLISCADPPGKGLQKLRGMKPIRVYRSVILLYSGIEMESAVFCNLFEPCYWIIFFDKDVNCILFYRMFRM